MKKIMTIVLLAAVTVLVCACNKGAAGYKTIPSGEMPMDGTWDGVYHSQAYGRMEFTSKGSTVIGLYESERWHGKIEGDADGDVLNFKWTQWNEDLNGKVRETTGHGYFKYTIKKEGTQENPRYTHFIKGEWGYGENNAGNPWKAVKFPDGTKKILQTKSGASSQEESQTSDDPFSRSGSSSPDDSGGGLDSSSEGSSDVEDDLDDLF